MVLLLPRYWLRKGERRQARPCRDRWAATCCPGCDETVRGAEASPKAAFQSRAANGNGCSNSYGCNCDGGSSLPCWRCCSSLHAAAEACERRVCVVRAASHSWPEPSSLKLVPKVDEEHRSGYCMGRWDCLSHGHGKCVLDASIAAWANVALRPSSLF